MTDQPTSQPAAPASPPPAPSTERAFNGVGLAALIVGGVTLLFAIIPVLSFIAWLPAIAAIVLGIVGLVLKGRKRLFAWLGLGLGVVGWIIAIIVSIGTVAGVAGAVGDAIESASPPALSTPPEASPTESVEAAPSADASGSVLRYDVTSDAATLSSVSYFTYSNGSSGQESAQGAAAPFSKEITLDDGGLFDYSGYSIVAQASADATTVTCTITVDGEVVSTQTSTGAFSVVTCTASSLQ